MKTYMLTFAATLCLGASSLFAGPQPPYGGPNNVAPRKLVTPTALKCDTMTIAAGGKYGGTQVVSCKAYANVRPADCRIACASK